MANLIETLKKLKAQRDSCKEIGSEHEAQAFAAMLTNLLSKHNLNMSDIEWNEEKKQLPSRVNWYSGKSKIYGWESLLARIIADANYCKILIGRGYVVFVGLKSGVDTCTETMNYMYPTAKNIATKEYQNRYAKCYASGDEKSMKGYRSSFLSGFVYRLQERFEEEQKIIAESVNVSGCTTLVRLSDAERIAEEGVKQWGGGKGHNRKLTSSNKMGREDGKRKANSLNVGGYKLN